MARWPERRGARVGTVIDRRQRNEPLRLGFIPLTDCAPLVVAEEQGLFRDEGLAVVLSRESSWANIRDKVQLGALDGAHMLCPMPLAASLGAGGPPRPMVAPITLNLNGNTITLAEGLCRQLGLPERGDEGGYPVSARRLQGVVRERARRGAQRLRFAMVFPFSSHNYQLRYWLAAGGIDPDRDVELVVIPPQFMASNLEVGRIDGFCAGEPWGSLAVARGLGRVAVTSYEIWNNGAEKVLAVTRDWAERHPEDLQALVRALARAGRWLDEPGNRAPAARWLARPEYVHADSEVLGAALQGRLRRAPGDVGRATPDFFVFHRYAANFPWHSHGLWYARQMRRWGQVDSDEGTLQAAVEATYRPDLYRAALAGMGWPVPAQDWKREGTHPGPWALSGSDGDIPMGPDRFLDGAAEPEGDASY